LSTSWKPSKRGGKRKQRDLLDLLHLASLLHLLVHPKLRLHKILTKLIIPNLALYLSHSSSSNNNNSNNNSLRW
jgi:hypothetical protein